MILTATDTEHEAKQCLKSGTKTTAPPPRSHRTVPGPVAFQIVMCSVHFQSFPGPSLNKYGEMVRHTIMPGIKTHKNSKPGIRVQTKIMAYGRLIKVKYTTNASPETGSTTAYDGSKRINSMLSKSTAFRPLCWWYPQKIRNHNIPRLVHIPTQSVVLPSPKNFPWFLRFLKKYDPQLEKEKATIFTNLGVSCGFLKLTFTKFAPHCGETAISKSKSLKLRRSDGFLKLKPAKFAPRCGERAISKPKYWQDRTTFWSWSPQNLHHAVARERFGSQNR